jgi:anthranilate phosphoribosyltransferase
MVDITIQDGLKKVINNIDLTETEAEHIMRDIMSGDVTNAQLGALLTALAMKGEKIQEITGFARTMREFAHKIQPQVKGNLLDTCGTGGDIIKTFNISTISALVIAGAGVPVAKHGNRAVTSKCGSADLLEGLGVNINLDPESVKNCIEKVGMGFMFAPLFHPAMKNAIPTRREIKIRTVFNILGPLTNPANAKYHILGVFKKELTPIIAKVLKELDAKHVYTVYNSYGIDEVAPVGINYITEYNNGNIETYAITNEDFNLPKCSINDILVRTIKENLKVAIDILLKNRTNGAMLNTVLMNAALGLKSTNVANDLEEGVEISKNIIESGKAFEKLERLIEASRGNKMKIDNLK